MNWYTADSESSSASPLQKSRNDTPPLHPSAAHMYMPEERSVTMFSENIGPVDHALLSSARNASQRKDGLGHTNEIFNKAHIGMPHPTKDALQNSRDTVLGNQLSADTTSTTWSSITSSASDGMDGSTPNLEMRRVPENPMSDPPAPEASGCVRKKYLCPKCNMGTGRVTRGYRGTQREYVVFKSQWDTALPFTKHVMEDHIDDFKRMNSSEYVCCYCPCASVESKNPECNGRFETAEDLVNHLLTRHSNGPRRLGTYSHNCAPISENSYPPALRARLGDI